MLIILIRDNITFITKTYLRPLIHITGGTTTWWNRPEEDISCDKLESTHPSRPSSSRSSFFMKPSQSYAETLTHYSTEPLTTGPACDTLLLLLALAGDVHTNLGPPRYPCSLCFKNVTTQGTSYMCTRCSHWVHSICSGLRNVADYDRANGCKSVPPVGCQQCSPFTLALLEQPIREATNWRIQSTFPAFQS